MLEALHARRAASIETRAHHAATSPRNDRPEPTEAQRRAGNYALGHVTVQGLRVSIENPAGSVRSGTDANGRIWRTTLQHHYGYLKGSEGADGDHVDCFIGPHPESELVFVIDQANAAGRFDEHKVVLGARSAAEARAIYLANYQAGWAGLGAMTALPIGEFKRWLEHHDTTAPMASNRLPAALLFRKAQLAEDGRLMIKADVENPGSRGGTFYVDQAGHIRYGTPPLHTPVFRGLQSRFHRAVPIARSGFRFSGRRVSSLAEVAEMFHAATDLAQERLYGLHLDEKRRPLAVECITQGFVDMTVAAARECLRNASHMATRHMVLVHNHPSGVPIPSSHDFGSAKNITAAARPLGITIRHHLVVGHEGYSVIDPHGDVADTFRWRESSAKPGRHLPGVEGRVTRVEPDAPWPIFERPIVGPDDAVGVVRQLLNHDDRIAILLAVDTQQRLTGVFPFAQGRMDSAAHDRAGALAIRGSATKVILAASADGPTWMYDLSNAPPLLEAVMRTGTTVLDYLVIGPGNRTLSLLDQFRTGSR